MLKFRIKVPYIYDVNKRWELIVWNSDKIRSFATEGKAAGVNQKMIECSSRIFSRRFIGLIISEIIRRN